MKKKLLIILACLFANLVAFANFTNVISTETTITASAEGNWGEVVTNLRDNDPQTKFSCFFNSNDGAFIDYELTSPVVIYKYSFTTANDSPGRDPKNWVLLGSSDGSDWRELDEQIDAFFSGRFYTNEYVLRGNSTAYKYYRLYINEIVGSDQLSFSEWKLYTENDSKVAPASLKLTGSALAEYADGIELPWKGGYYELYTSLKSGNYSFDGDNSLTGNTIDLAGETKPYRIQVDYRTLPAVVSVQMIEMVDIWAPFNQFMISELSYAGNSTFTAENLIYDAEQWGDDRYRVRVFFEEDSLETYGAWSNTSTYLTRTHNDVWGTVDGLSEWNTHVPDRYKDTGLSFNLDVQFNPIGVYIAIASDYIPNTMPEELSIQGTAVVESEGGILNMKQDGTIFEIYTALSSGTYSFVGDEDIAENTVTVDGESVPYRIRVNYSTATPVVTFEEITSVYMWVPMSDYTVAYFQYEGNSIFRAENVICDTYNSWFSEHDSRHRIRIEFDYAEFETYAPKGGVEFALVGNDTWGGSDYNYDVDTKYYNTNVAFDAVVSLSAERDYSYVQVDPGVNPWPPTSIESILSNAEVYPTIVNDNLNIELQEQGFEVEIISISGLTVLRSAASTETLSINVSSLPKGVYLVKIVQNNNVVTKKIIKL